MVGKIYSSNQLILNEARDYIDGLLLSDGTIVGGCRSTGMYIHRCKYKNWLDIISEYFFRYNILNKVNNGRVAITNFSPKNGSIVYTLHTHYYIEFRVFRDRWYKKWYNIDGYQKARIHIDDNGEPFVWKKVIPKDICLTPPCVTNWYLGDGSLNKKPSRITLATNDFSREDVIFLSDMLLESFDIKSTISKSGVLLINNKKGVRIFIDYIKDYKVDCYNYKYDF